MPTTTEASTDGYALYDHSFASNIYSSRFPSNPYPPLHLFPSNPYTNPPPPPPLPLQQPVAHKVWILDCKCGSFLTNRGMKAVLLLRPNVPLYSSDALPANCSAYTSNPEVLKPPSSCRPPMPPSRTCECLTQTLCCHGCGSTIGYMIVIPCIRCTSSISANNRATNGHRFVFHSSEVVGSERHYVPKEPGVIPFDTVPVTTSPPPSSHMPYPAHAPLRETYSPHSRDLSANEYLPTPPLDMADLSPVSSSSPSPVAGSFPSSYIHNHSHLPPGIRLSDILASNRSTAFRDSDSVPGDTTPPSLISASSSMSFGMPVEQVEQPLRAGDLVFWHHLIRHGEIPGVSDDPRARKGRDDSDSNLEGNTRRPMVFGR